MLSCKHTEETTAADARTTVKDSTIAGADQDEHGCLASAGFTWSKMYKDCVRMFTGMQLTPVDQPNNEDETLSAYVLFSEDKSQAEVFMPNSESIILNAAKKVSPGLIMIINWCLGKDIFLKKEKPIFMQAMAKSAINFLEVPIRNNN